jgi:hypothetical protein
MSEHKELYAGLGSGLDAPAPGPNCAIGTGLMHNPKRHLPEVHSEIPSLLRSPLLTGDV